MSWWSKHPENTSLKGHVPLTVGFEIDYSEFLDEALVECWELREAWEKQKEEEERDWWVLKPGMSEQGQGVRLFSSEDGLRAIFEEWEAEDSEGDEEEADDTPLAIDGRDVMGAGTMTSQLRHFVAQRYIARPLLFPEHQDRKFHIRAYVLAVGALRVYIYKEMLALFAPLPYQAPSDTVSTDLENTPDPRIHLTNTCLQDGTREGSVVRFWDLPAATHPGLGDDWKDSVSSQICAATGTLFEAAAREQMIHFQTLGNAFEVFGVDWVVDEQGTAWLLEVNAFPDFKQSGEDLKQVVKGLWDGVVELAVMHFFRGPGEEGGSVEPERFAMRRVLDIDLGRR